MKKLDGFFHYRSVDVSSIKELVARWYPKGPELKLKSEKHIAMIDIRESIEELRFYRKHYFISNSGNHIQPTHEVFKKR